jgi:Tol biopolymer transport system component
MKRTACTVLGTLMAAVVCALLPSNRVIAQNVSDWSNPINLGPLVNSPLREQGPAISNDGLSLFFGSERPGRGDFDIWVSQRARVTDPWGTSINVASLNTASSDTLPSLSSDGHWLFFTTDRPGGRGDADVWATWRRDSRDDFNWEPAFNLGPQVNSALFDAAPEITQRLQGRGPLLYFARGPINTALDIYVTELARDGSFGSPVPSAELNSTGSDARVSVSSDGLEMFFYSDRPGSALNDLWKSTRKTPSDPWSSPVNVGAPLNTEANETHPKLSPDGLTLYFISARPGGSGSTDLWVATRNRR